MYVCQKGRRRKGEYAPEESMVVRGEREKEGKEREHDEDERMTAQTTTIKLRLGSFTLEGVANRFFRQGRL